MKSCSDCIIITVINDDSKISGVKKGKSLFCQQYKTISLWKATIWWFFQPTFL